MLRKLVQNSLTACGYEFHKVFPHTYFDDGLRTTHDSSFTTEPKFRAAYQHGKDLTPTQKVHQGPWRAHVATWAASTAIRREGDFVECGVWMGFVSSVAMTYVNWNKIAGNRKFYLIDSFEGLSETLITDEERKTGTHKTYGDSYAGALERAKETTKEFKNVEIVKGFVPHILNSVKTDKVAYLHLDMNAAIPETEALKFFWPKMSNGGVVLFDDYAYAGYKPQKVALDDVAEALGFSILSLPTGQGIVIK
jgi:hypothetical protein